MNDNHELLNRFTRAFDALALAVDAEVWDAFKREANAVAAALRASDRDLATARAERDAYKALYDDLHDAARWTVEELDTEIGFQLQSGGDSKSTTNRLHTIASELRGWVASVSPPGSGDGG